MNDITFKQKVRTDKDLGIALALLMVGLFIGLLA